MKKKQTKSEEIKKICEIKIVVLENGMATFVDVVDESYCPVTLEFVIGAMEIAKTNYIRDRIPSDKSDKKNDALAKLSNNIKK